MNMAYQFLNKVDSFLAGFFFFFPIADLEEAVPPLMVLLLGMVMGCF